MNVAGSSLRGVSMEEARRLLRSCSGDVDIILARPATTNNGDQTGEQLQYSEQSTVGVPTRACPFTLQNLGKPYQQARRFNNHSLYTKKIFIDGC